MMKVETQNLSFSYSGKKYVLKDINLTLCSGKAYILKGKNGSGKTTLSKLLCGILKTKEGKVIIDDEDIYRKKLADITKKIGYLYQNTDMHFFAETVYDELLFPYRINDNLNQKNKEKTEDILKKFELEELKQNFPLLLSAGEKQRLALATIFIRDIDFVILDEPTTSIDIEGKRFLAELLKEFIKKGKGVLIITHDEEFQSFFDDCTLLQLKDKRL